MPEKYSTDKLLKEPKAFDFWKSRESLLELAVKENDRIEQALAKGESNEKVIRTILRKYLPSKFGIVEGFLLDQKGHQSKQTDVIIYDRVSHPDLFYNFLDESKETHKFIPIDSAVATIEVKTTLKGKVVDAFDNISSTRKELELINPLVVPATWGEHFYTGYPSSFVFAFRSGWSKSSSIKKSVRTKILETKIHPKSLFDLIYVNDKDVTLGWVFGYERSQFLVRPCDHWDKPLHLTEITPDDSAGTSRLGLFHFLSQVIKFVKWFQVPRLELLLHHYGSRVKMKYATDDDPIPIPKDKS